MPGKIWRMKEVEEDLKNRSDSLMKAWGRGLRQRRADRVKEDLMHRHRPDKDQYERLMDGTQKPVRMVFQRREAPVWSLYACVVCMDDERICHEHEFVMYDLPTAIHGYVQHVLSEGWFDEPIAPVASLHRRRCRRHPCDVNTPLTDSD